MSGKYNQIIADVDSSITNSELIKSNNLAEKKKIESEINAQQAEQAKLDEIVRSLATKIAYFETKANEFGKRAKDAGDRAFATQIVGSITQAIASAVPAAALMATGTKSAIIASTIGQATGVAQQIAPTAQQIAPTEGGEAKETPTRTDEEKKVETQQALQQARRTESELSSDLTTLQGALEELETKITKADDKPDQVLVGQKTEVESQITNKQQELTHNNTKINQLTEQLDKIENGLRKTAEGLNELGKQQKSDADMLYELQNEMLKKSVEYEERRIENSGELARIVQLLKTRKVDEDTVDLAIRSLNLSISALKQAQSIVENIRVFFEALAAFLNEVQEEIKDAVKRYGYLETKEKQALTDNKINRSVKGLLSFFVRQAGEWRAIQAIAQKYEDAFENGFVWLNENAGKYLVGASLNEFLEEAWQRLATILNARTAKSEATIEAIGTIKQHRAA